MTDWDKVELIRVMKEERGISSERKIENKELYYWCLEKIKKQSIK